MYTWRGRRFEDTSLSTPGKSGKTGNRLNEEHLFQVVKTKSE